MAFFPPGFSQGVVDGLDQYQQRANTEQLMAARAQRMREEAALHQMEIDQQNRLLDARRGGGNILAGQYDFLTNSPTPPQPGQASVPMQQSMQRAVDYPNWDKSMIPANVQQGVIPFNQPVLPPEPRPMSPQINVPQESGLFRTAQPDYVGLPPEEGRREFDLANGGSANQVIPPYKTINREQQTPAAEAGGGVRETVAPPPLDSGKSTPSTSARGQSGGGWLSMQGAVEQLQKQGVPKEKWLDYLEALTPALNMAAREELAQVAAEFKAAQIENKQKDLDIKQLNAEIRDRDVNSNIDTRAKTIPIKQQMADAATTNANSSKTRASNAGQASPGNMNSALNRQMREMAPIDEAQRQSGEIRGLIATASPASTPQIQRILSNYMNAGRTTNQLYVSNANFGDMYERGANALSRMTQGDYSDVNKEIVLDMINKMENTVFAPARAKLNAKYRMQAQHMKMNPDAFDAPNSFGEDQTPKTSSKQKMSTEDLRKWAGSKGSTDMGGGWTVTERK